MVWRADVCRAVPTRRLREDDMAFEEIREIEPAAISSPPYDEPLPE